MGNVETLKNELTELNKELEVYLIKEKIANAKKRLNNFKTGGTFLNNKILEFIQKYPEQKFLLKDIMKFIGDNYEMNDVKITLANNGILQMNRNKRFVNLNGEKCNGRYFYNA